MKRTEINFLPLLLLFITLSCEKKIDIKIEKINESYFGDYRVEIDTIGRSKDYLLNNYTIHFSAIHREYFKGITTYSKPNEIYKIKLSKYLYPKILNEKLIITDNEFYLTENNGIWWNCSNPKNIEYYINPFYSRKRKKIQALNYNIENFERGIYYVENGKLNKVQDMNKKGNYYLTRYSMGILKEFEINKLLKKTLANTVYN